MQPSYSSHLERLHRKHVKAMRGVPKAVLDNGVVSELLEDPGGKLRESALTRAAAGRSEGFWRGVGEGYTGWRGRNLS